MVLLLAGETLWSLVRTSHRGRTCHRKIFSPEKTTLIRNFPIVSQFPRPSGDYQQRSKKVIYVGLLSHPRGAIEMAEAARIANAGGRFKMIFAGDFSPLSLRDKIVNHYPVEYIQWMEFSKVIELMMDSRAGMIIPHPIERYTTNYPIKLFEYMAAGLPVIASKFGESARFVNEAQSGMVVDPLKPVEIADAIQWLLDHPAEAGEMGARGRRFVEEKWNWENESKVLIDLYQKLFLKKII
ncbi:MAG: glycosyltransferase [Bacteroidota bacterium]